MQNSNMNFFTNGASQSNFTQNSRQMQNFTPQVPNQFTNSMQSSTGNFYSRTPTSNPFSTASNQNFFISGAGPVTGSNVSNSNPFASNPGLNSINSNASRNPFSNPTPSSMQNPFSNPTQLSNQMPFVSTTSNTNLMSNPQSSTFVSNPALNPFSSSMVQNPFSSSNMINPNISSNYSAPFSSNPISTTQNSSFFVNSLTPASMSFAPYSSNLPFSNTFAHHPGQTGNFSGNFSMISSPSMQFEEPGS